jgi:hypothetical protein
LINANRLKYSITYKALYKAMVVNAIGKFLLNQNDKNKLFEVNKLEILSIFVGPYSENRL